MKIALVHDWLTGMRGGERCLEVFCELFPEAPIYTLLHIPGSVSRVIEQRAIHTSFIEKLPFAKRNYRTYLPLFPMAIEHFNLRGYDLIISLSHCVAKGIIPPPDSLHLSYLFTPMRYAWDMFKDYFGDRKSKVISVAMHYLRLWDVASSQRVDHYSCISHHVAKRILKYYRREAEVIHPPVDTKRFKISHRREDFFLIVSSLSPYKRIDLAMEAFKRLKYPLIIIGSGPEEKRLKSKAGANIRFLGWQPDEIVADHYSRCRALIFPGEEDFGIVPLEAMASGRPVIAYGKGGALESVIGEDARGKRCPTGLFFFEPNADSLIETINRFFKIEKEFDPESIRNHSLQWDREIFKEKVKKYLEGKLGFHVKETRSIF
ncbi:MAG: glycosyltransferase [Desulfobacterota bacterium]|nr:glycosyltransferase [Thermodesulfobacteriota bacterium]